MVYLESYCENSKRLFPFIFPNFHLFIIHYIEIEIWRNRCLWRYSKSLVKLRTYSRLTSRSQIVSKYRYQSPMRNQFTPAFVNCGSFRFWKWCGRKCDHSSELNVCPFLFRSAVFKFIFPGERRLPVDSVSCISNNIVGRLQYNILHICIGRTPMRLL